MDNGRRRSTRSITILECGKTSETPGTYGRRPSVSRLILRILSALYSHTRPQLPNSPHLPSLPAPLLTALFLAVPSSKSSLHRIRNGSLFCKRGLSNIAKAVGSHKSDRNAFSDLRYLYHIGQFCRSGPISPPVFQSRFANPVFVTYLFNGGCNSPAQA